MVGVFLDVYLENKRLKNDNRLLTLLEVFFDAA